MAHDDRELARRERLALLSQTAPDTLMGRLLRSFWHPVAVSADLAAGATRPLRILNEDLTLFRSPEGAAHLVGARCAHRCVALFTGWVEGDAIRCMYHGWKYDGVSGRAIELPAETQLRPETVRIPAYAVHEYGGLIFAYLGNDPVPPFDLPRKHVLERPGIRFVNREIVWDCNWFQQIENSLDGSHLAYAHKWGGIGRFVEEVTAEIPSLAYEETSAGVWQTATRSSDNIRISDWTFPNNNHIREPGPRKGYPWFDSFVWAVPVDEYSTRRFFIFAFPDSGDEINGVIEDDRREEYDFVANADHLLAHRQLPPGNFQQVQAQDYVAVRSQGVIMDRGAERLGQTDAGIAFLRRVFLRELDALRDARPTKRWTRIAEPFDLPISAPRTANV